MVASNNSKRILLKEGGLAGHISHLYEDDSLSVKDFKELVSLLLSGNIYGSEKTDGINIYLSYNLLTKDVRVVRNKKQLEQGGVNRQQLLDYFSSRKKLTPQNVIEAFLWAIREFEKFVLRLNQNILTQLFGNNSNIFYNCEILCPECSNIIQYSQKLIVVHRTGNIGTDSLEELEEVLQKKQYNIIVEPIFKLNSLDSNIISKFSNKLKQILEGLQDTDSIFSVKNELELYTNIISKLILSNVKSMFADVGENTTENIKNRLMNAQSVIINSNDEEAKDKFLHQKQKLGSINSLKLGVEGFVFNYKGKTYKITGVFAPINQILNLANKIKQRLHESLTRKSIITFIPGSFKPPHRGHLAMVQYYAAKSNKVFLIVSSKPRFSDGGVEFNISQTVNLWKLYLDTYNLSDKIKILVTNEGESPIKTMLTLINALNYDANIIIGMSDKDKSLETVSKIDFNKYFNNFIFPVTQTLYKNMFNLSSRDFRNSLNDFSELKKYIPTGIDINLVLDILKDSKPIIKEMSAAGAGSVGGFSGPIAKKNTYKLVK